MIQFSSVRKEYPGGALAVEDFSLTVPTGSVTVLVGSSGCGKTTLLRMVNRMVDPTAGVVSIDGISVAERDPVELRRSIGYVMQSGGLLPHKTVADNIQTVAKLRGVPQAERAARVDELMSVVGLDPDLATRYPAQLSGGQQQRVGVARALAGPQHLADGRALRGGGPARTFGPPARNARTPADTSENGPVCHPRY